MGRDAGDLALWSGLAAGAETILIPEVKSDIEEIAEKIQQGMERGKKHSIIVCAEGVMTGNQCGEELKKFINIDTRVSCLGHIQRGGTPTGMDRVLASRLGGYAVELLIEGESAKAVGIQKNILTRTNFDEIFQSEHSIDNKMYELANQLSI